MSDQFNIENKKAFDVILVGTQALAPAPAVIILTIFIKGQDVTTKFARKITGSVSRGGGGEEESGLELAEMNSRTFSGGGGEGLRGGGGFSVRTSKFRIESPMSEEDREKLRIKQLGIFGPKKGKCGKGRRGDSGVDGDDVKPPPLPPSIPPPSDDEDDVKPPPSTPPTFSNWTRQWDEKTQEYYYQHSDGVTSTWEKPDDYVS
ncbi:hypothetical protein TrVE_jg6312 [Triparma verrucosa]|uniref:WW domain-containing protein n=1 Tax=Triparma verrucosa TaxID=1606542 RepID=A0A9W7F0L9_9STRA|nr:hypothetical protein TrVE_jg6312 [Triparma verrucosa]